MLNVGAAGWTTLIQRSIDWTLFKIFVNIAYPDKLDQQVLIDMLQVVFDPVDGMSFATIVRANAASGTTQALLQMSVGDMQVCNLAAEIYTRSAGLTLLGPAPLTIHDHPSPGPLTSGMTVWNTHPMPLPPVGNIPGDPVHEQRAHRDPHAAGPHAAERHVLPDGADRADLHRALRSGVAS